MGMHSMSNSNTKRNLYNSKHRVIKIKRKQKRLLCRQSHKAGYVDPVDLQLMHEFHSKKRIQGASANVALSGKKRRKLLRAHRRIEREKLEKLAEEEEAEAEPKKVRKVRNVEMRDAEETEKTESESISEDEMET